MDSRKRKQLEKSGYRVTDTKEFVGLSDEEDCMIRTRLALVRQVRELRKKQGWTQVQLAHAMGSTQARVAKLENASPEVSVDLLLRVVFALGTSPKDLAKILKVA